ncbi:formiminotetrahydrofolate cyclodeaminase [Moryella indoligenes]|uniref:Formiminotetrahydrofolate cyclodeaminase n=1 Tax=Moryella indoligenes TaxID=371674 RepID=A0AAE3VBQ0_9FIRM|nr:cyclodeaminase/cyclohydrolase family protein [Moryella indoligenes]MDQ0153334.1 formiminotetrahydrofolate cyclodeaminase [Moryella indoligenes]
MMKTEIINEVIDSNNFEVGGGAASALAGAMAAGMLALVARLSLKKPVGLTEDEYNEIIAEADQLSISLVDGANNDAAAFRLIKAAYAKPKQTEEEKKARTLAIREAGYQAALVPKNNGYLDKRVYELACKLEGASNPACYSDLMSAKFLASAGVRGCALNINANLSMIKNPERVEEMERAMKELNEAVQA